MNKPRIILIALLGFVATTPRAQTGENVDVPSGIDHGEYDRLLKNM